MEMAMERGGRDEESVLPFSDSGRWQYYGFVAAINDFDDFLVPQHIEL
jgi:hypothetical protein